METKVNTQSSNAAVAAQDSTPLTPEVFVGQMRIMRQQIPDYTQLPVPSARLIRSAAHVNSDFVEAAINAAGASLAVQGILGKTPDELRQQAQDATLWTVVEEELKATLKGVTAANLIRRHRVGNAALQTYIVCRGAVRAKEHLDLLPHVAEMKRLNRIGRKRKAAQPQAPTPAPAPHATS
jgi:hypothetical protein